MGNNSFSFYISGSRGKISIQPGQTASPAEGHIHTQTAIHTDIYIHSQRQNVTNCDSQTQTGCFQDVKLPAVINAAKLSFVLIPLGASEVLVERFLIY